MKQLTQEQAERCARACGWEDKPHKVNQAMSGKKRVTLWFEPGISSPYYVPHQNNNVSHVGYLLPLDPHFWFPRLWEVAGARYWDEQAKALIVSAGPLCMVHASSWDGPNVKKHEYVTEANSPCLALRAAIEALEEKCPK